MKKDHSYIAPAGELIATKASHRDEASQLVSMTAIRDSDNQIAAAGSNPAINPGNPLRLERNSTSKELYAMTVIDVLEQLYDSYMDFNIRWIFEADLTNHINPQNRKLPGGQEAPDWKNPGIGLFTSKESKGETKTGGKSGTLNLLQSRLGKIWDEVFFSTPGLKRETAQGMNPQGMNQDRPEIESWRENVVPLLSQLLMLGEKKKIPGQLELGGGQIERKMRTPQRAEDSRRQVPVEKNLNGELRSDIKEKLIESTGKIMNESEIRSHMTQKEMRNVPEGNILKKDIPVDPLKLKEERPREHCSTFKKLDPGETRENSGPSSLERTTPSASEKGNPQSLIRRKLDEMSSKIESSINQLGEEIHVKIERLKSGGARMLNQANGEGRESQALILPPVRSLVDESPQKTLSGDSTAGISKAEPVENRYILSTIQEFQAKKALSSQTCCAEAHMMAGDIKIRPDNFELNEVTKIDDPERILDAIHNRIKVGAVTRVTPRQSAGLEERAGILSISPQNGIKQRVPIRVESFVNRKKVPHGSVDQNISSIGTKHMLAVQSVAQMEKLSIFVGSFIGSFSIAEEIQKYSSNFRGRSRVKSECGEIRIIDEATGREHSPGSHREYRDFLSLGGKRGLEKQLSNDKNKETRSNEAGSQFEEGSELEESLVNNESRKRVIEDSRILSQALRSAPLRMSTIAARNAASSIESLIKKANKDVWTGDEVAAKIIYLLMKASSVFTFEHSSRVVDLSLAVASELGIENKSTLREIEEGAKFRDIGEVEIELERAPFDQKKWLSDYMLVSALPDCSFLHDIGKVKIPESILHKPGPLTKEEYEILKRHPEIGEEILKPIQSMRHVLPVVRHHHEKWDGTGYPDRLIGEEIPLAARIVSITDAFDAMVSERPYKRGRTIDDAIAEIRECAGSHFDPVVVNAFLRVIKKFDC